MANIGRNFVAGKMNKVVDERLVPEGEYIDALNIRMGSTEQSEIGVIENSKGNERLTSIAYNGTPLSANAICIGAIEDSANDTIYWFVHDPSFPNPPSPTGKLDLIVSYSANTQALTYHLISIREGASSNTTLNFNPAYLITGVNLIDEFLYWTDDYNQPRFINTKRSYANPAAGTDGFSAESILVIKKPPMSSPSIQPYKTNGEESFMEERFICFAYRYKYIDGEYSATSQWTEPAFFSRDFSFDTSTFLNEGMKNEYNASLIRYDSGGPLVVGIDLLFKEADSNIIKVIEKLDKTKLGLLNNTTYTYSFDNSKIFTILPESELLRLYDNVPRLAKAQAVMGNRIMYGNYLEGYDMIDSFGFPVNLTYTTELVSSDPSTNDIDIATNSFNYSIGNIVVNGTNNSFEIDFTNYLLGGGLLTAGSLLNVDITFEHDQFAYQGSTNPNVTTPSTTISLSFLLPDDYASVYDMAISTEFQNAVGTALNVLPVWSANPLQPTSCDGLTLTDIMYCSIPTTLGVYTKYSGGINAYPETFQIIPTVGVDTISISMPAVVFVDDPANPAAFLYEYYTITAVSGTFQLKGQSRSLHSNRGYEIGIVYMDEFGRSTTALVSPNNTVHIPCEKSSDKNSIHVTIPTTQRAPSWAKKYKFVIKPDAELYETIYSNVFYVPTFDTANVWVLLEGENARKVEKGDRLIVKADTSGPTTTCVYTTVLDKEAKASGVLDPSSPSGVYAKFNKNDFSIVYPPNAIINRSDYDYDENGNDQPNFILNFIDPITGLPYDIPAGSRITISMSASRLGGYASCSRRKYSVSKNYVASANFTSLKDWFDTDNIAPSLNTGSSQGTAGSPPTFYSNTIGPLGAFGGGSNVIRFRFNDVNGGILQFAGYESCSGTFTRKNYKSELRVTINIFRATDLLVFETMPQDALPDVFYENHLSFDIVNGNHYGNIQNQNIAGGIAGIVDTEFSNCYMFGNGVESYKIRDSIVGKTFNLGNRVTTVAAQDYKEARRYSDITYSGVYNNESNVNKLNEFNLGLLNYKPLEDSFGRIFKMDGRQTDLLVLQEDKISYVLVGKDLLSDAGAGGALVSVPEVLGKQIARAEKYGISFNPESYVHWGYDRYFTDAKRGVVIQMKGDSYSNDQISIVSERGMRTWFRDEFNASFKTQKLGGFDPYMNEYVLSTNERTVIGQVDCVDCGFINTFTLTGTDINISALNFCVELGSGIGDVSIDWTYTISPGTTFNIGYNYNGITDVENGFTGNTGFLKGSSAVNTADISIYVDGSVTVTMTVSCPETSTLNLVEVVVTSNSDAGKRIHAEYNYNDPTTSYISPLQSNIVTFGTAASPFVISRYNLQTGPIGSPLFPTDDSLVTIQTNKIAPDNYDFVIGSNKLMFHRSTTYYGNTIPDVTTLLSLATDLTVSNSGNVFYAPFAADFIPPAPNDYLYLIWDLRRTETVPLCYGRTIEDVCCNCQECDGCVQVSIKSYEFDTTSIEVNICGVGMTFVSFTSMQERILCLADDPSIAIVGGIPINYTIRTLQCGCEDCIDPCSTYIISNIDPSTEINIPECGIGSTQYSFTDNLSGVVPLAYKVCGQTEQPPAVIFGGADIESANCGCDDCEEQFCWRFDLPDDDAIFYTLDTIQLAGPTIYYTTPPIPLNDVTGMTNFLNNVLGADCSVGYYSYTPAGEGLFGPTTAFVRIGYTCCQIDNIGITSFIPPLPNAGVPSLVTSDQEVCYQPNIV